MTLLKTIVGWLCSLIGLAWSGMTTKKTKEEELTDDLQEAKRGEEVFAAPPRDKQSVIDAFRMHARDD